MTVGERYNAEVYADPAGPTLTAADAERMVAAERARIVATLEQIVMAFEAGADDAASQMDAVARGALDDLRAEGRR